MSTAADDKRFSIRLRDAGLSEVNGEIIAQGFLDIEALTQLKVGDYQREVLKSTHTKGTRRTALEIAIAGGARPPSIVLGMRGQNYRMSGDDMLLYDPLYIVDGLQRTFAMMSVAEKSEDQGKSMAIGAEVRFETSREIEKELFETLNTRRTSMSPNIILRNSKDHNKSVLTIYGLSVSDSSSPIYERVQWNQRRGRGELMTGLVVVAVMGVLHRHVPVVSKKGSVQERTGNGRMRAGDITSASLGKASALEGRVQTLGLKTFRENVIEYFEMIDQSFGIRKIEYSELCTHLRGNFLQVVAQLLSDHTDFWDGDQLVVSTAHKRKLASFAIDDPNIVRLSGGSNTTKPMLYELLREHMDKRMKKKLTPRMKSTAPQAEISEAA